MTARIILQHPHVQPLGGDLEYCCDYVLSEAVEGITGGEVGYVPAVSETDADVLEKLRAMAADHMNERQTSVKFDVVDVLTWEVR
jgi:hypothetical protein